MMENAFYEAIAQAPIIASVKNQEGLEACLENDNIQVVFLLFGDILTLKECVEKVQAAGKIVIVHMDFVNGLQCAKDISVDYVQENTGADGIITTHPNCIRRANELGMYTVLRAFILDSMALENVPKQAACRPDFIEILPGVIPKAIHRICEMTEIPLLAGGLFADKEDVISALHAGALGISSSDREIWNL